MLNYTESGIVYVHPKEKRNKNKNNKNNFISERNDVSRRNINF